MRHDWVETKKFVDGAKLHGKVVFTNGCFDLFHYGHLESLRFARGLGQVLIVGVNTDRSVRALKGSSRPIVCEKHRAAILSACRFVDKVVLFDEDTPQELIEYIRPDILVKGYEYTHKYVAGANIVENVYYFPNVEGCSTSHIIERVKKCT